MLEVRRSHRKPPAATSSTCRKIKRHMTCLCLGQLAEHFQYLGLITAGDGLAIVPVHRLSHTLAPITWQAVDSGGSTYHRPLEVLGALLVELEGLALGRSALDYGGNTGLADILQDGLELVGGGRVLGDVELELNPVLG